MPDIYPEFKAQWEDTLAKFEPAWRFLQTFDVCVDLATFVNLTQTAPAYTIVEIQLESLHALAKEEFAETNENVSILSTYSTNQFVQIPVVFDLSIHKNSNLETVREAFYGGTINLTKNANIAPAGLAQSAGNIDEMCIYILGSTGHVLTSCNIPIASIYSTTHVPEIYAQGSVVLNKILSDAYFYIIEYVKPTILRFLPTATPDISVILNIPSSETLEEFSQLEQIDIRTDSGDTKIITLKNLPRMFVKIQWNNIQDATADSIVDLFMDLLKAKGLEKSFIWVHPVTEEQYVVRFASPLAINRIAGIIGRKSVKAITLEVLGPLA